MLLHGERPTGTVLIFDGEGISTGPGIVELLGAEGAKCILISPSGTRQQAGRGPRRDGAARGTIDLEILPQTYLREIGENEVKLARGALRQCEPSRRADHRRGLRRTGIDNVILAAMRLPTNSTLEAELDGKVDALYIIGDGLAPRDLRAATFEGQRFARLLGEPDAPATTGDAQFAPVDAEAFENLGSAASLLTHASGGLAG